MSVGALWDPGQTRGLDHKLDGEVLAILTNKKYAWIWLERAEMQSVHETNAAAQCVPRELIRDSCEAQLPQCHRGQDQPPPHAHAPLGSAPLMTVAQPGGQLARLVPNAAMPTPAQKCLPTYS